MKACDVLVIGGGLSGLSCAIPLAQAGKHVLLAERRSSLAWECTRAYELDLHDARTGVGETIRSRLAEVGGLKDDLADAAILEMVVYRLCREHKLNVLLYTAPLQCVIGEGKVEGMWLGGKGSSRYIRAKWIVDATDSAVLWKLTRSPWKHTDSPSRYRAYFNRLEKPVGQAIALDDTVTVRPAVWKTEACLELVLPSADCRRARQELIRVIPGVRKEIKAVTSAMITHTAHEPFPSARSVDVDVESQRHPALKNLLGCGVWCGGDDVGIAARIRWGEQAARLILSERASESHGASEGDPPAPDWRSLEADILTSDVAVVGGGTGGAIAALAAAREGARTVLMEQGPVLGGMGTGGGIHYLCPGRKGKVIEELFALHDQMLPLFADPWRVDKKGRYHPEAQKAALMQLLAEAGVEVLYNTTMVSTVTGDGRSCDVRITDLLGAGPVGLKNIQSTTYIDATGDGDVARVSGATYRFGRQRDGRPHAYTQAGPFLYPEGFFFRWNNNDGGFVDPTDVEDLTRERMRGIDRFWYERFTEANRVLHHPPLIGIRQSVQIDGDYVLSFRQQVLPRTFTDSVVTASGRLGAHGRDFESESYDLALWVWGFGFYGKFFEFDIPFRSFLPKGIENLLLASRCLSLTYDAFGPARMQPTIMLIGEAAGRAAALAKKMDGDVRRIDVERLRAKLKESKVLVVPRKTLIGRIPTSIESGDLAALRSAVWHCEVCRTDLFLEILAREDDPYVRFLCGIALSRLGDPAGDDVLLDLVRKRCPFIPNGGATLPLWKAAICFLRTLRDKASFDNIVPLLEDSHDLAVRVSAVQLLGRSGLREAIDPLRELLDRLEKSGRQVTRRLRRYATTDALPLFKEPDVDETWAMKLNVARSLIELGEAGGRALSVVEEFLEDPRAVARRFAKSVMEMYRLAKKYGGQKGIEARVRNGQTGNGHSRPESRDVEHRGRVVSKTD